MFCFNLGRGNRFFAWHGHVTLSIIKNGLDTKRIAQILLEFEFVKKLQRFVWNNVAGEQGLLTSNIFHTNPSNFPKIQPAINTHSATLGGSNLATFILLKCSFRFSHLFCTTTVFDDWQGHVTVSCKEPIEWARVEGVWTYVGDKFFHSLTYFHKY